ncbi:MAG: hypothetical protein MZV64_63065 [Ignavibacteriales bacterium]|nr:hypothetical protein [Ignavibacteriales bacterium]
MPVRPKAARTELAAARCFSLRVNARVVGSSVDMAGAASGETESYHIRGAGATPVPAVDSGRPAWSIFPAPRPRPPPPQGLIKDKEGGHGRRLPGPAPVRAHRRVPLPVPADDARPVAHRGHRRDPLPEDEERGLQAAVRLPRQDPRDRLRHGRGHGHRPRIRLRQQLGRLLPDGRRHLRRAPRRRGRLLLLPRVRVPGHPRLRPEQGLAEDLPALGLPRLLRRPPVGPVDHHRQFLDADAGRVPHGGRPGRPRQTSGRRLSTPRPSSAMSTPFSAAGSRAPSWPWPSRPGSC